MVAFGSEPRGQPDECEVHARIRESHKEWWNRDSQGVRPKLNGPRRRATSIAPTAKITVEDAFPTNRKPPQEQRSGRLWSTRRRTWLSTRRFGRLIWCDRSWRVLRDAASCYLLTKALELRIFGQTSVEELHQVEKASCENGKVATPVSWGLEPIGSTKC